MHRKRRGHNWTIKKKRKGIKGPKTYLPQDLILANLMLKLPGDSLLQFKCVSKSWYKLISSNEFVKCHLEHNCSSDAAKSVLFMSNKKFSIVRYEDVDMDGPYDQPVRTEHLIDLNHDNMVIELVGSCNGLVCFSYRKEEADAFKFRVLNPVTVEYEKINYRSPVKDFEKIFYGFWHVASTDEYKLVGIGQMFFDESDSIIVDVVSMGSRRRGRSVKLGMRESKIASWSDGCGSLVNETVHWVTSNKEKFDTNDDVLLRHGILGFDLVDEKFKLELEVPSVLQGRTLSVFDLTVIKGCLCTWSEHEDGMVEVWMMKEYGLMDSWTKLFNFDMKLYDGLKCEQILDFTNSGKLVMLTKENRGLVVIDLIKKRKVRLAHTGTAVKYVESLMSPVSIGKKKITGG